MLQFLAAIINKSSSVVYDGLVTFCENFPNDLPSEKLLLILIVK